MTISHTVYIHALDYEGRGVAHYQGKTLFVEGALPQEQVQCHIQNDKGRFALAKINRIIQPSIYRQTPSCPHFDHCGGCVLQHVEFNAQVAMKQRIFEEQLQRIGRVTPQNILPPIYGSAWHYRDRTRLNIAVVQGKIQLGYQAWHSHRVINLDQCPVLPKLVSAFLPHIRTILQTICEQQPQIRLQHIEINQAHNATAICIASDKSIAHQYLKQFYQSLPRHQTWQIWQQVGKKMAQVVMPQNAEPLYYLLPEFNLSMPYQIGDFTQINTALNQQMISRAMRILQPKIYERIADLFCGLGNFTLPIAQSGAQVVGIEGADYLTQRAIANARANGLNNVQFLTANLFDIRAQDLVQLGYFDKILLDPPRAGAYAVVQALHFPYLPRKIVYVSCNPATLARDAQVLVSKGYQFKCAGIMNMFPHTAHIEAIAEFCLDNG